MDYDGENLNLTINATETKINYLLAQLNKKMKYLRVTKIYLEYEKCDLFRPISNFRVEYVDMSYLKLSKENEEKL